MVYGEILSAPTVLAMASLFVLFLLHTSKWQAIFVHHRWLVRVYRLLV